MAQISANERFALFLPEKRPFFLEGVDLFSTRSRPSTRAPSPRRSGGAAPPAGPTKTKYTLLVADDAAAASSSSPARPARASRIRTSNRRWPSAASSATSAGSFASFLYSGREIDGGGYNRVVGPDFRWRPDDVRRRSPASCSGASETPNRPELAEEWDGRRLAGHAGELWWNRSDGKWDCFVRYRDLGDEFRADNGFIPQVGYREGLLRRRADVPAGERRGAAAAPVHLLRLRRGRRRPAALPGGRAGRSVSTRYWNSFVRFEFELDEVLAVEKTFDRFQIRPTFDVRPGKVLQRVLVHGPLGRRGRLRARPRRRRRHPADAARAAAHRSPPADRQLRPALARRRNRGGARRAAVHRRGRAPEGRLHVQLAALAAADRPVDGDRARPAALGGGGRGARGATSPARRSSPTSSTGRRCSTSATRTSARSTRSTISSPPNGRRSSRSRTHFAVEADAGGLNPGTDTGLGGRTGGSGRGRRASGICHRVPARYRRVAATRSAADS